MMGEMMKGIAEVGLKSIPTMKGSKHDNNTNDGEGGDKSEYKRLRRMIDRYYKEIKEYRVTKFKKELIYIGIPIDRAEELMGGIEMNGPGTDYPAGNNDWTTSCVRGLEVKEGGVAAWAGENNKGLFVKKGYAIKAWSIIGIYSGIVITGEGMYVLEMESRRSGSFNVDARRGDGSIDIFGMMNQDIHKGVVNAHLEIWA
jgi:hypothetical protein